MIFSKRMRSKDLDTMIDPKVIQVKFETLEDFRKRQNNFHLHFCYIPELYNPRILRPVVERFSQLRRGANAELSDAITRFHKEHEGICALELSTQTWNTFFSAYDLMRRLVYRADPYVVKNGVNDTQYLID